MIRKYNPEDVNEVIDVWRNASLIAHPFLSKEFMEQEANTMRYFDLKEAEVFVYESGEGIAGFVAMVENDVGALFIDPAKQRKGIGKALLDYIIQSRNYLTVDVFKENVIGLPFYIKYGFEIVNEFPHKDTGDMVYRMKYIPGS